MRIDHYEPDMVEDICATYNRAVAKVPHCYPVAQEEFAHVLAGVGNAKPSHERLSREALLVAIEGARIVGFVHGAIASPKEEREQPHGSIVFLSYEPGRRAVGQNLLEEMESRLLGCGIGEIRAYEQEFRYPFYGFRHAYLSHHLGHIQALLGMNGYVRIKGEIFLDWPGFEPVRPDELEARIEIGVQMRQGRGTRPGIEVRALRAGEQIGFCGSLSCGDFSHSPAVQDWIFTDSLNISDEYQGRGLGKHILRRSLLEAHRLGYRHAAISNDWNNHRAFLFYTNFGYHVADWTYCLSRRLDGTMPERGSERK